MERKKENPKSERLTSDEMRKAGIEGEMRGGDGGSGRAIGGWVRVGVVYKGMLVARDESRGCLGRPPRQRWEPLPRHSQHLLLIFAVLLGFHWRDRDRDTEKCCVCKIWELNFFRAKNQKKGARILLPRNRRRLTVVLSPSQPRIF